MSNIIDLTLDEEEDVDVLVYEPTIIPFINYNRVPANFIPICPSSDQSIQSNFEVAKRGKKRKLNHAVIARTFACLDNGSRSLIDFNEDELDLDREIFGSGKLYFLTKLFEQISQHENLTDVEILILTSELPTEKLIYRICNEKFGYPCVRLSRQYSRDIPKVNNNHTGVTFGVIIKFMSAPDKAKYMVDKNYEFCNQSLIEYIIIFNGDVLPNFYKNQTISKHIFDEEPTILTLCTIGTSEFRFKEYISRSKSFDNLSMEIFINHANDEMRYRFSGHNAPYSAIDFTNWNNLLAKQVASWLLNQPTLDYDFEFPLVAEKDLAKPLEY